MDNPKLLERAKVKHIHFVGIGGIGLSAIARVLHADGFIVSGSDARMTALTRELRSLGMTVYDGHSARQVGGADLLVVSSAIPADNVEILAAREAGIPVVKRARLLGEMMAGRCGIAVAGTHGKTTTSALIAFVLTEAGLDPTFVVGGILQDYGVNARFGAGPHFVIEADEYDNTFLGLSPELAVVTVIEMDHPDCFSDITAISRLFGRFLDLLPDGGAAIGCMDQPRVVDLMRELGSRRGVDIIGYGLGEQVPERLEATHIWRAQEVRPSDAGGSEFVALRDGHVVGRARLALPGIHNVSNALAVLAVADRLDVDMDKALEALPEFHGVRRRFEVKGESGGVVVVDDYAHHPTEIRATLSAARRRYTGRRLWAFFQPHTYSRTKALFDEFAASFGDADRVVVAPIYAARETDDLGVSAEDLVRQIAHRHVRYVPSLEAAGELLTAELKPGDVLLTLGAGNGNRVGEYVLDVLGTKRGTGPLIAAGELGVQADGANHGA